ncbi:MAG TPA: TonB-dependent receptor plug domain-containing protein [Gemmatimonadaceae bacterium]|nr:TonB-dependent receptor plug domain-containing protein [Gemmatimonadaceae bacterium]
MPTSPLRIALPACLLVGLAAGCASGGARRAPPDTPAVTTRDLENRGDPIEKVLQDKVPGLLVTRTADGGIALQIRGPSSFLSGTEPLYVVDDVPVRPGPGGALMGVNPHDIESIRVLKDPADTGIYGARGANGVILVTTKRPPTKHP